MDTCSLFSNHSSELNLLNDKGSDRSQKFVQKLSDALFSSFLLILLLSTVLLTNHFLDLRQLYYQVVVIFVLVLLSMHLLVRILL